MKRLPYKIRVLLGVAVAFVLCSYLFTRVYYNLTTEAFSVSNIRYAVDAPNNTVHVTATVKNTKYPAAPICNLKALDKNAAPIGVDNDTSGPWLDAGQKGQVTGDFIVLGEEAPQINSVQVDCLNID